MILERLRNILLRAHHLITSEPIHHHYKLEDFVLLAYSKEQFHMQTPSPKASGCKDIPENASQNETTEYWPASKKVPNSSYYFHK